MGEIKNLSRTEAIEKMKQIAEKIDMCMFCTQPAMFPMETRPMSTQKVDDEGNLWFLSSIDSKKNDEISNNSQVQLIYSDPGSFTFMTVSGTASISHDRQKIEELWKIHAKAWFTEGKDDPHITVVKVIANDAYYWDTKHNKMVAMFKMISSIVTGETKDDGVEGTINPRR